MIVLALMIQMVSVIMMVLVIDDEHHRNKDQPRCIWDFFKPKSSHAANVHITS